ncbi:MAG: imidazole glycerol phosphate synthase subunit HisF [Candidatus Lokiarchaeota archaeon]|nr:imidazole glycerol phosphate synthase subunit HisF [Candidatus Lokiarchaeota archaeon]
MNYKKIVPCLDMKNGKIVKGVKFVNLREVGDPAELASVYDKEGADELVLLDITASHEKRDILIDVVKKTAKAVSIPFTVGGGLRSIEDVRNVLKAGADKVSLNTSIVKNPNLVKDLSSEFGSDHIVAAIDAKRIYVADNEVVKDKVILETSKGRTWWEVYTHGGRKPTGMDAIKWAIKLEELGAGELLPTSMDYDGVQNGYDIPQLRGIADRVSIPITASGGAGKLDHFLEAFKKGKVDAALAASIFHFGTFSIKEVKEYLKENGVDVKI